MIDSRQYENNTRPDMIRTNTAENSAMTVVIHTKTTENNAKLDMFDPKQYHIDPKPNMTCVKTVEIGAKPDMIRAKTAENYSNPDMIHTRTLENGIRVKKWNLKTIKRKMYLTDGQNPVANKNYISIGVSVRTNKRTARNNGGAARQENRPQSATAYSSVRYGQC